MIDKIFFDITNKCNGSCLYCFTESNSLKDRELLDDQIVTLFNNAAKKGVRKISIGGGEPFIRNISTILRYANKELKFSITTNGTVISNTIIDLLAEREVKLTVSLDSLDANKSEKVRKGINLHDVMRNIEVLASEPRIKKNLNIRCTVTNENVNDLFQLVDYCEKLDIPNLKINSINNFGRAKKYIELIPEFSLFIEKLCEIEEYSRNKNINIELPVRKYLGDKREHICTMGKNTIYIDSLGNVFPCAFSERNLLMGNILLNDESYIINNLRKFNYDNETCERCPIHRYE